MDNSCIIKIKQGKEFELSSKGNDTGVKIEKSKQQGTLQNLKKKSVPELEKLLITQKRILQNKVLTSKLEDKGKKLKDRCQEIEEALKNIKNKFGIAEKKSAINIENFEWNGYNLEKPTEPPKETIVSEGSIDLDSDDEDINPLQLLANHSEDVPKIRQRVEDDPTSLLLELFNEMSLNELEGITETGEKPNVIRQQSSQIHLDYKSKMLEKITAIDLKNVDKRPTFKPFRPKKPSMPVQKKDHSSSLWAETSATGCSDGERRAVLMSLRDSFDQLQINKQKEMERQRNAARLHLSSRNNFKMCLPTTTSFTYRDVNEPCRFLAKVDNL